MASGIYNRLKYNLGRGSVNLLTDTCKVLLMNGTHAFATNHLSTGSVTANEITGTGYTAGGASLSTQTLTEAATLKWDAADIAWTGATFSASHAVIYDDTNAADELICSIDFGTAKTVSSGTFTIVFHTDGIISLA